jgi:hypothetical protein
MRRFSAAVIGASLAVWQLAGCNVVLGIEPAEVDAASGKGGAGGTGGKGTGGSSTAGTGNPGNYPFVAKEPACTGCMMNCSTELAACVSNIECRYKLNQYTTCLAKNPSDAVTCKEQLPLDLQNCLGANCDAECTGSALVSRCELYCECLTEVCPDFPVGDCVASCPDQLSPAKQDCVFLHCQVAGGTGLAAGVRETHCKHATLAPGFDVCPASVTTCIAGRPSKFACTLGGDCCSGMCDVSGVCD